MSDESYVLGSHTFRSRLIIGSGKYESFEQNLAAAEASGAEMVTVALRRTKLDAPKGQGLLDFISPDANRSAYSQRNTSTPGSSHASAPSS